MSWANFAVPAYDVSVQSFLTCALSPAIGAAVNTILKVVGVAQDAYGLAEAIKSKDPVEIIVASLRLTISLYTLKCQCFTGETLVSTEDGFRRIDEIEVGDKVWAYNTETGETELKEVLATPVTKTDILVHLTLSDGEEIQTTMFHPFYVQDEESQSNGRWVAASNLVSGDELLMEDGQRVYVERVQVEKLEEEINVYNLEVDEWHTYFVGGGVLVHNKCENHHIASDKSIRSGYTSEYEEIFESAGMSLQDEENIVSLENHKGAHTKAYKEFVLQKLRNAINGKDTVSERREALKEALGEITELLLKYTRLPYADGKYIIDELL